MTNANGQTLPAETIQAMGADAARAVLGMGLTAEQQATVIAQVRDQKAGLDNLGIVSPWHEGFLGVIADQAVDGPVAKCPGCSADGVLTDDPQVLQCTGCGGFFTDSRFPITMEQAIPFVRVHLPMLANAGDEGQFFFDLDITRPSDGGRSRMHGWADQKTKRVVQWG